MRLLLDRLVMTPPFLVITLAGLHFLQNGKPKEAVQHMRRLLWGALLMNWKARQISCGCGPFSLI